MSKKYFSEEEAQEIDRIYGQRGRVRASVCICPKCSKALPRIRGQRCGTCPKCGVKMVAG